jgi:peptidyl-prolyl cis-trans isomerase D
MAAIGKIRSWGPVLVGVIGIALFAFIAGDLWKSCEATGNQQRQQVGSVLGNKISVQDFQTLVDERQEVMKLTQGRDNLTEDELNRLRDEVWQFYSIYEVVKDEADKLGLTVTDEELENVLKEGTNPMLRQLPLQQFINPQTQRFDYNQVSYLLNMMKQQLNNPEVAQQYESFNTFWKYIEKTLRQYLLISKYQTLLGACQLSNPISAKAAFDAQTTESDILLAAFPYTQVSDSTVQVTDAELKAKYNEMKEAFKTDQEIREIKYVSYQVLPSASDREELMKEMKTAADSLAAGAAPAQVVRQAHSQVAFNSIPVTRSALPTDAAAKIDSMSVGQTSAPFETRYENTLNVVKLISKQQLPDSIEYRMIQVGGATLDAARKTADSILVAVKGGAPFDTLAVKYGQTGAKEWMTSQVMDNPQYSTSADTKALFEAMNNMAVNELRNVELAQGNVILQVTARKKMVDKYVVAVVKRTIDFSKQTYSDAYNKFSQYVSENKTIDQLEQNAEKFGFRMMENSGVTSDAHYVAGIRGTRDALKWVFDSKPGDVSELYECGNNDVLLVVGLTKVNPKGYRELESVKDAVRQLVLRDKKFEVLAKKFDGLKSIEDAKAQGAIVDTVKHVMFSTTSPASISATNSQEPALSGAVSVLKKGEMSKKPIKGNGGAFMFQVLDQRQREGMTFDAKQQELMLQQQQAMMINRGMFLQELLRNANIEDKRYLFF